MGSTRTNESDYYRELNEKLRELTVRVRDIKSITIGVNLDSTLRADKCGALPLKISLMAPLMAMLIAVF